MEYKREARVLSLTKDNARTDRVLFRRQKVAERVGVSESVRVGVEVVALAVEAVLRGR